MILLTSISTLYRITAQDKSMTPCIHVCASLLLFKFNLPKHLNFILINVYAVQISVWHSVVALCSICKRVGMDWTGSPTCVICCDNIDVIYDTFFLALKDYTLDSRGDVGLW